MRGNLSVIKVLFPVINQYKQQLVQIYLVQSIIIIKKNIYIYIYIRLGIMEDL